MKKHKGKLTPNIQKLIEELKKKSMEYIAHWNGKDQFEVAGCYDDKHNLHLGEKTCSCSHLMMPLLGPDEWPHSDRPSLLPPISERMSGRPKKQDRRKKTKRLKLQIVDIIKDHVLKVQRINNQRNMLRCLQVSNKKKEKRKADVMSQESNLTTSRRPLTRSVAALQEKQVEVLPLSQRSVTGPGTPSKTRKKMKVISKAKQGPHNIPSAQQKKKKTEDNVAATSPSKIATSAGLSKTAASAGPSKTVASARPSIVADQDIHFELPPGCSQ
ncbi:UNVERIFIED_CONTAM: hypothetical protein Slati_3922100 [Sesamum latifolium]|uniref:Uncharacterized protein n=1 Tax=Sesamum latifolium TaxID=2727402 RepID=A0AAW2TMW5_9LAMI